MRVICLVLSLILLCPISVGVEDTLNIEVVNLPSEIEVVVAEEIWGNTEDVPILYDTDLSAKPYMDYRKITDRTSNQYQLIYSDEISVDDNGYLVDTEGNIGVAMGSYFGDIGTKYIIHLDTGISFGVVKVEEKADIHTCENNFMASANDVIEFVIDTSAGYMQDNIWSNGYIWQGNFNNCPDFQGNIVKIERINYGEVKEKTQGVS